MLKLSTVNPKRKSNEGADVAITIDGEPTGAVIRVLGKYSDVAEKLQREAVRRLQRQYSKSNKFVPPDPTDAEQERIAYAVACTMSWSGIEGADGKPLATSISFRPGETMSNFVAVKTGADGAICISSSTPVHAIWDQVSTSTWYLAGNPVRTVDTRS